MDDARFDALARALTARFGSRRAGLRLLGAGALAALGRGGPAAEDVGAAACSKAKPCPPCRRCKKGTCKKKPDGAACGAGKTCRDGRCVAGCEADCTAANGRPRTCGADGCGGSCGTCPAGQRCAGYVGSEPNSACCKQNGQISNDPRDCCSDHTGEIQDKQDVGRCVLPTVSERCCAVTPIFDDGVVRPAPGFACSSSCDCCLDYLCRGGTCCRPTGTSCGIDPLECCSGFCGQRGLCA
jgi:hypothetical protein